VADHPPYRFAAQVLHPELAPRVKVADVRGRALMIHHGADRYQDHAHHHQGMGGARMYCGVIGAR
jgi:superoxide dismutase, Cu-Zn family